MDTHCRGNIVLLVCSDNRKDFFSLLLCSVLAVAFFLSAAYHILCGNDGYFRVALTFDVSGIFSIILGCVGTAIYNIASSRAIVAWRTTNVGIYVAVCYHWVGGYSLSEKS